MKTHRLAIAAFLIAAPFAAWAQNSLRGHWRGTVDIPGNPLAMEVDLDQVKGDWIGSIAIPAQNASGVPLEAITFTDGKCTFHMKAAPGDPTFTGALSPDGNTMTGDLKQADATFAFKFTRTGDPQVEVTRPSPPVAKEFLGDWEGALEVGQQLRMVLKVSNNAGGAKAVLVSLDQGVEIPVNAIDQKGSKLTLTIKMIGGRYEAEINKDASELNGTWIQSGNELPLKLKKASK